MIGNLVNHIVFVVDRSYSMAGLQKQTVTVFDNQIEWLAERSKQLEQETRVSVYLFGSRVECIIYDMDVLRLPSLSELYNIEGNTKLVDATLLAIEDLKLTPQKYGDHAFLMYVLTDGEENESRKSGLELSHEIRELPVNWTLAAYVPNQRGIYAAKQHGFPSDNIAVWNTTKEGMEKVGSGMKAVTEQYFQNRSKGIRGSKSLFKLDLSKLTQSVVAKNLQHLAPWEYRLFGVGRSDSIIREFVERKTGEPYVKGSTFYELVKSEIVQPQKRIIIVNNTTEKAYGGSTARKLLNLPDEHVRLKPEDTGEYTVYIESTSFTRKLPAGTSVIVLQPGASI